MWKSRERRNFVENLGDIKIQSKGDDLELVVQFNPDDFNDDFINRPMKWLQAEMLARKAKADDSILLLAEEAHQDWWNKNRQRLIQQFGLQ